MRLIPYLKSFSRRQRRRSQFLRRRSVEIRAAGLEARGEKAAAAHLRKVANHA